MQPISSDLKVRNSIRNIMVFLFTAAPQNAAKAFQKDHGWWH